MTVIDFLIQLSEQNPTLLNIIIIFSCVTIVSIIVFLWGIIHKIIDGIKTFKIGLNNGLEIVTNVNETDNYDCVDNFIEDFLNNLRYVIPNTLEKTFIYIKDLEREIIYLENVYDMKLMALNRVSVNDMKRVMLRYIEKMLSERLDTSLKTKIRHTKEYMISEKIIEESCDDMRKFSKTVVERNNLVNIVADDNKLANLSKEYKLYIYNKVGEYSFREDSNISSSDFDDMLVEISQDFRDTLRRGLVNTIDILKELNEKRSEINDRISNLVKEISDNIILDLTNRLTKNKIYGNIKM